MGTYPRCGCPARRGRRAGQTAAVDHIIHAVVAGLLDVAMLSALAWKLRAVGGTLGEDVNLLAHAAMKDAGRPGESPGPRPAPAVAIAEARRAVEATGGTVKAVADPVVQEASRGYQAPHAPK